MSAPGVLSPTRGVSFLRAGYGAGPSPGYGKRAKRHRQKGNLPLFRSEQQGAWTGYREGELMQKVKVVVANATDVAIYMVPAEEDAEKFLSEGIKRGYVTIVAGSTVAEGTHTIDKSMFLPISRIAFVQ